MNFLVPLLSGVVARIILKATLVKAVKVAAGRPLMPIMQTSSSFV